MKNSARLAAILLACASLAAPSALAAETTAASPAAPYPLAVCVVSAEALGSMGDAYVHLHKEEGKPDREVRLCCKGCLKRFAKDPAKYLAKLDAALAQPSAPAAPSAPAKPAPAPDAHAGHAH